MNYILKCPECKSYHVNEESGITIDLVTYEAVDTGKYYVCGNCGKPGDKKYFSVFNTKLQLIEGKLTEVKTL